MRITLAQALSEHELFCGITLQGLCLPVDRTSIFSLTCDQVPPIRPLFGSFSALKCVRIGTIIVDLT